MIDGKCDFLSKNTLLRKFDLLGLIVPLLLIATWYFFPLVADIPAFILPSLQSVIIGFIDFTFGNLNLNIYSGTMFAHMSASFVRVFNGFVIAAALGLTLGYFSGCSRTIYRLINPIINFLRTIPGIAWLPISIVWFGIGNSQSVFLISLAAFFPVYINTCHGVFSVDEEVIAAAKICGTNRLQSFRYIILPLSLPDVSVGLRVGLGLSWAYLVLGEQTGVNRGIGAIMQDARMLGQHQMIIISMLVIALTAIIFDKLFLLILKSLNRF